MYDIDITDIFNLVDKMSKDLMSADEYSTNGSYPYFNIIKKDAETQELQMALAGYDKDHIEVSTAGNTLVIKTKTPEGENEPQDAEYLYKGIANRNFVFKKSLSKYWFVTDVVMKDGLLRITFHREIPEEAKPKVYEIK